MKVSRPIAVAVPPCGVLFAQSTHAANFRMATRADPFHKLLYVLAGQVAFRKHPGSEFHAASGGSILVIPKGTRHEIHDRKPSTLLLLCLDTLFFAADPELSRLWLEISTLREPCIPLARPSRLRVETLWRQALLEASHQRLGQTAAIKSLATQVLVTLARLPPLRGGDTAVSRVASVIREVDESFFDEWTLDRAALRAGLSRRRFSTLFRQAVRQTFGDYLNDLRLRHAARLLQESEHSILGTMFSCGFRDLSHFYRQFRKQFGRPPRDWAQSRSESSGARAPRLPKKRPPDGAGRTP